MTEDTEATGKTGTKTTKDKVATGCGCLVIGLVALGVVGVFLPDEDKTKAPSTIATATTKPVGDDPHGDEVVALYRRFLLSAKPCDRAVDSLAKAANTGDQYATYSAAKDGHEACRDTAMTVASFSPPAGLSSEARGAVEKAIERCRDSYLMRQTAMSKAMEIADGDARPSAVSDFTDTLKAGQAGLLLCVGEWFGAAGKVGVDPKRLS